MYPKISIQLPSWVGHFIDRQPSVYTSVTNRAQLAIDLSAQNVHHHTGGPFGAAVFAQDSGRLISVGTNIVVSSQCSLAHAEMVALTIAQQQTGQYRLGSNDAITYELVTSTEPCAMCLGAIGWSGIRSLVCCARGEDAEAIGFHEGDKPTHWADALESRGISVTRDILREQARQILKAYQAAQGPIY